MNWLIRLVMAAYGVPDGPVENPDYVIPLSYCLLPPTKLPDAAKKALLGAIRIAKKFPGSKIIFASSVFFWLHAKEQEDETKLRLLQQHGIPRNRVLVAPKGARSSVEDALNLKPFVGRQAEVVVVPDWIHARSVKAIWNSLMPRGTKVRIRSIKAEWSRQNLPWLQKSAVRWLLANLVRHSLFTLLDKKIAKFHQPI